MEEGALRLEPQAYGATIGIPGARGMGFRVAAVCAALVSLLAVSCALLMSGFDAAVPSRGLPGFELSLNSAMETFFQNTAARERKEAAAQRLTVQQLSFAPSHAKRHIQHFAQTAAKPASTRSHTAVTPPATSTHKTPTLLTKKGERAHDDAPRTAAKAHIQTNDRDKFLHKLEEEHAQPRTAQMEGLATKPSGLNGLDNKPWAAPSSDFQVKKARRPQASPATRKKADFDVRVPSGLQAGQAFLVQVPGHRERKVTVPPGIRSGQLVSIDVPAKKSGVTKSQLDAEEPSGEELPSEAEETDSDGAGDADAVGDAATMEATAPRKNEDAAVNPVVFGDTPEQQEAAQAVNEVHDLFRKDEDVEKKWVPGDTQPIPKLEPLGQTTEDQWSSAPEVYGDQTSLRVQSCAARCNSCKSMGAGNWYCQQCGDVCSQINHGETMLKPYTWKIGAPRGAMDPMVQAEAPVKHFLAVTAEDKDNYMKQPMIPTKKRWYQKTTQITHFENGGVSQITSNPKWPVQSTGLSALASLYKPGEVPNNLPVLSSLATVEGRQYKRDLMRKEQRKQVLDEEEPAEEPVEEDAEEAEEAENVEAEGVESAGGEAETEPEKTPGFIVATPDDKGPERRTVARKTITNVNVLGPAGPSYVQIHTTPGENPQHFGAYAKPNFRSEYPTTQTITVNPAQPVVRMVSPAPQPAAQQSVAQHAVAAPTPATSIVTSYQPAAMAAKQQTMQTNLGSGGLMFQLPAAAGIPLQPATQTHPWSASVTRVEPSVTTTITTPQATAGYMQQPPSVATSSSTGQYISSASPLRVAGGAAPTVQVVRRQTHPSYESLSPIPSLQPMPFFDKKRREKEAVFRHWDGKEMQVLNVLPEKPDGEINLDPQNWQGQNMVISEGARGAKADRQFSEAMKQVTEGLHAAANSELHYKGGDRSGVTYREYGDVNAAVGEPADPSRGGPTLVTADPFGLKAKEASSAYASINDRAGAVPTGSKMEEMVVKVPAGLKPGQEFTAETGAGEEEEVTVPEGVKAGGDVEIDVPEAPQE